MVKHLWKKETRWQFTPYADKAMLETGNIERFADIGKNVVLCFYWQRACLERQKER